MERMIKHGPKPGIWVKLAVVLALGELRFVPRALRTRTLCEHFTRLSFVNILHALDEHLSVDMVRSWVAHAGERLARDVQSRIKPERRLFALLDHVRSEFDSSDLAALLSTDDDWFDSRLAVEILRRDSTAVDRIPERLRTPGVVIETLQGFWDECSDEPLLAIVKPEDLLLVASAVPRIVHALPRGTFTDEQLVMVYQQSSRVLRDAGDELFSLSLIAALLNVDDSALDNLPYLWTEAPGVFPLYFERVILGQNGASGMTVREWLAETARTGWCFSNYPERLITHFSDHLYCADPDLFCHLGWMTFTRNHSLDITKGARSPGVQSGVKSTGREQRPSLVLVAPQCIV